MPRTGKQSTSQSTGAPVSARIGGKRQALTAQSSGNRIPITNNTILVSANVKSKDKKNRGTTKKGRKLANPNRDDRPERPRRHIIEDQSFSFLSTAVHKEGHTIEGRAKDYGIDFHINTFDGRGMAEAGDIKGQLKATDRAAPSGSYASVSVKTRTVRLWLGELLPVYLILYFAKHEVAYWVEIRSYIKDLLTKGRTLDQTSLSIKLRTLNALSPTTIREWRSEKNTQLDNLQQHR